jgi:RNA polymerase sigma factor (sigma-70 family)
MLTVKATNDPVFKILLCRAKAGDRQALGDLITLYRPGVSCMLLASIDPQTAEEVIQETDLAVTAGIAGFLRETREAFGSWYRRIATHKRDDALRRKYRRRKDVQMGFALPRLANAGEDDESHRFDVVDDRQPKPDESADKSELLMRLQQLLARLDDTERSIVTLRHDGETLKQIAEKIGRSESTVSDRYVRAIEKLRRFAREDGLLK